MVLFVINHWRGLHSAGLSLIGTLIGLGLLIHMLFGFVPETSSKPLISLIIVASIIIVVWQITGTLRSCERSLRGGGDMILYWGCYGASVIVAALMAVDVTTLLANATRISPPPAAHKLELVVQGNTVLIDGTIGFNTNTALLALFDDPIRHITTARLNSDGGRIFAARAIANTLIAHGVNTEVSDRCASACTLIFLAGNRRRLLDGGQLGFHQYLQSGNVQLVDPAKEQQKDRAYFKSRGVTQAFIARMFQAKHQDIWFPTGDELRAAGIVTD